MLSSAKADPKFTSSESHREAVARYVTAQATTVGDVGELLSDKHAKEKTINRRMLLTIL